MSRHQAEPEVEPCRLLGASPAIRERPGDHAATRPRVVLSLYREVRGEILALALNLEDAEDLRLALGASLAHWNRRSP